MRSILQVLATARQLWPLYLGIIVGAVASSATALLTPVIIGLATDRVISVAAGRGGSATDLLWYAGALLLVTLVNSLISNGAGYLGDLMSTRLRVILSQRYYAKLLRLPQRYYDSELTGTIISRLNRSITAITDFLQMFSNGFFPMLLTVLAVLVISGFYSPWLALLLVVIYPTFVWLTALTSKRWQRWEHDKNELYDDANGRFAEVIGQMRVVKSFVSERTELARFGRQYDLTVTITKQQSRFWHLMDLARRVALDLVFFVVFAIIFYQTATGAFTVGAMVLLIQLVTLARQPVTSMSYLVDTMQRAIAGSREYFRALCEVEETSNPLSLEASEVPWEVTDPVISFKDVDFGYDPDALVLRNINLDIRHGERVALVGESGGGKTTLVNLIMSLYQPSSGDLRVCGHSVTELPSASLRKRVGVVFQDASLFSGAVRENLAYGNLDADEAELLAAARRANAAGFIKALPQGLDTEIGERGIKLSGGQKQRIAVARALLKNAPILILDEATSSLDSKAERQVQAGLEELMTGRTTLIIAHRLSTISSVDRIVTLRDGEIDEVGTPDELADSGGIYAELLALQRSSSRTDRAKLLSYDITS